MMLKSRLLTVAMDECELKLEFGGDGVLPGTIGEAEDDWEADIAPQSSSEVFGQSSFSSTKASPFDISKRQKSPVSHGSL